MPPPRRSRTEVLFVMPPGGAATGFTEHVGIGFLRAMLLGAGIRADQCLPAGGVGLAAFARDLREARPRVVGFTVYESNLRACRALARAAREALPEAVLLAGGPNATFSPEETLDLLGVDACLRGAGEGDVVAVVQAILGARQPRARLGALLAGIPNLVLRQGGERLHTAPASLASFQRDRFATLDDLPSPYQLGLLTTAEAGLLTARGCNQHCTYCSFAELSERRVAFHSVERVLEDLAAWRARLLAGGRRPARVSIMDDAFTLSPARARAICEGIVARGLRLPFECETRADRVDPELLRLMRRAGFVEVHLGLESAVPRVLRAVGKVQHPGVTDDPGHGRERAWLDGFERAVRHARAAGLEVQVSVIGGLPGEAAADFEATLDFVERLGVRSYAHNVLQAMPGTPLHRDGGPAGRAAARDRSTGSWITPHAYDVRAVAPRRGASVLRDHAAEALQIADALCGRPRRELAAEGAAWAAVLHGAAPEPPLAAWLKEVLAVGGAVLVIGPPGAGRDAWRAWASCLREGLVPHGLLAVLSPEEGGALRSVGTGRPHLFDCAPSWPPEGPSFQVGPDGRCRVAVWLAAAPGALPPADAASLAPASLPQIADGCRWWRGWPRCAAPAVLHVRPGGAVGACWHGPALGAVGDPYAALVARAEALTGGGQGCPLGSPPGGTRVRSVLERLDVQCQVFGRRTAAAPFGRPAPRGRARPGDPSAPGVAAGRARRERGA